MDTCKDPMTYCDAKRGGFFYFNERLRKVKYREAAGWISFDFNDGLRLLNDSGSWLIVQAYGAPGEWESWLVAPGRAVQSRAAYFVRWNFDVRSAQTGGELFRYRWSIAGAPAGFQLDGASPPEKRLLLAEIRKFCRREKCFAVIGGAMEFCRQPEFCDPAWLWCDRMGAHPTAASWQLAGTSNFTRRIPARLQGASGRRFAREILKG